METLQRAVTRPKLRASRSDQVVVLHHIPWAQYDALCVARADSAGPRMAYLDGTLEIMSPARKHEVDKKVIARFVEAYGEETGLSLNGFGSETFRRRAEDAGVEPDECYCVGGAREVPDFAIEVVNTSGGIDKLEIYRRLKVAEVWFWQKGRFWVYRLVGRRYAQVDASEVLPDLDLKELARVVTATDPARQTEAVRAWRKALREREDARRAAGGAVKADPTT
jgi:Uma2 family endonuclease